MDKKYIKTKSAILLNNYNKNILFTLQNKQGLFIGKKEFYDNAGNYDNSTNTLKKITSNIKLLNLLSGTLSHIALAGFIYSGRYTLEDICEFYEICKKLNIKYYDIIDNEKDNKYLYTLEARNKTQREKQSNNYKGEE